MTYIANKTDNAQLSESGTQLGTRNTLRLLIPYFKRNFMEQLKSVWFIVAYLMVFQVLILQLPLVYSLMICFGIFIVMVGLMFFMEGLRLGLMPLGESIGSVFPHKSKMPTILGFAFLLGIGATFAEPAIAVLKAAGSGVSPDKAPLLYSLLNDFSGQLVMCVGIGVGFAVLLGVMRFFYGWSLKLLIIPVVSGLLALSAFFSQNEVLQAVLGLAWDCGAVTTGPVTVPLVLALGIGVCRVVSKGNSNNAGFGIVTLASLFPILAVLMLALYHYSVDDYYGAEQYKGEIYPPATLTEAVTDSPAANTADASNAALFSEQEFNSFVAEGNLDSNHSFALEGGQAVFKDGKIILENPLVVIEKTAAVEAAEVAAWDSGKDMGSAVKQALMDALRAIIPLCIFLFFVLRVVLKQKLTHPEEVGVGVIFALTGMTLFGLGITLGLTPLGSQLGSNVPSTFAEISVWGASFSAGPMIESGEWGKMIAIIFAFYLGYGATLAEPALNALGDTVERITVGAFRKRLLMQSVAIGVGLGIAAGILKIAYNVPLITMLVPPYLLLLVLTWISSEEFVNFGWDSAGVTTGPITVPLVLAIGLGVGGNVPGVTDGFGVLALASVGPILTVLTVGLITNARKSGNELEVDSVI
jgi:hypothetical protein